MVWKKITLGKVLSESRILSETPNPDRRITVKLNVKGVEKRALENDVLGATKYFIRRSGQFIYGKQNLFKGAFGIIPQELDGFESSTDIPAFDVKEIVLPEWIFYFLLQGEYYKSLESIARGTGSRRIHPEDLYKIEIPQPPIEEQEKLIKYFKNKEEEYQCLSFEIEKQNNLIKKLRQSILQEAVQGKLTEAWRKENKSTEPASQLLKRIKAEKGKLVKEGKLKKEKPLPPITEDEIPFELPEGWEWCRLGEIGILERGKSKHRPRNDIRLFKDGIYPLIQTGDVSQAKYNKGLIEEYSSSYNEFGLTQSRMWPKGTLCITIAANIAETGFLNINACFPDSVVGYTYLVDKITSNYVQFFLEVTKSSLEEFAPSTAQKNINLGILTELLLPLPPLAEQHAIVAKVNTLMQLCDELEAQVAQSKKSAEQLMQAVLREAFSPKAELAV